MAPINFATPLQQSCRSEVLEWRFPKPHHDYVLTGKSRAAWHTSFVIPQLNLLLDAGLCVNNLRPKHIFLTHGHTDHTLLTPAFVKRDDPPDIFCPFEMTTVLNNFISAKTILNLGGVVSLEDVNASEAARLASAPPDGDPPKRHKLNTHEMRGLRDGDVVPLRRTKNVTAMAFSCDHSLPCLGYVFSVTTNKLKLEYQGKEAKELQSIRKSGIEITEPISRPVFAFLGDTTANTLAAAPQWLQDGIPVVITECSFLYEEHRGQAEKTKHTMWSDLEKVIRRWPQTTFILMHFSLRYTEKEIRQFFHGLTDAPSNIVVWIDGCDDDDV
ncbi:beta-lactamase-like protein [Xylariales sp. PMI_506]|nr:beta-lactamase-like protein [Xylariales sp. PMI_506]